MSILTSQSTDFTPKADESLGDVAARYPAGEARPGGPDVSWLRASPARGFRPLTPSEERVKRTLDIVCALGLMALSAPIVIAAAMAIKLTSPGPVIYTQVRTGLNRRQTQPDRRQNRVNPPDGAPDRRSPQNADRRASRAFGRPFTIYKLRTMRTDAERDGAQLAKVGDARVTPVGRFLRRSRIDELPQLWNVLRDDMSIVGPRPERPEFIGGLSREVPGYLDRLGIRPGLTGLAQVLNGYDDDLDSVRRKVHLDLLYLQHYSLTTDIRILLKTVGVVLKGSGAR